MKNVLLINPDPVPRVSPPLGLCYIAEVLQVNKHNVTILDMGFNKEINLGNADYIGVVVTTLIYAKAKEVISKIRELNKDIPIIIGGPHASLMPDFVLKDSGANAVVVGEGELTMLDIANGKTIPEGIINAPIIEDLDSIPFPRYNGYIDMTQYFKFKGTDKTRWGIGQRVLGTIGKRGCPFRCTYCASNALFKRRVRSRSVKNIMEEIDYSIEKYNIQGVSFYDDTLTLSKEWMKELCEGLAKRKLKWICNSRIDTVDEEILTIMKKSGCLFIAFGIESGSNRVLKDIMQKGITIEQAEKTLRLARKIGIGIVANYMFGLPGETEEDLKLTLEAIKRLPADIAEFSIFIPLPGTALAGDFDWTQYDCYKNPYHVKSPIHSEEFNKIISDYHHKAIISFYFAPMYLIRSLRLIFHPQRLYYSLKSFYALLKDSFKKENDKRTK